MSKRIFRKKIVVGIVIVFFAIGLLPNLYAKTNFDNQKKSTVTLYAFGENFFKENKIDISTEDAKIIFNNFNELKKVIINDPHSDKAQVLRINFVNILEEKSMLPKGVSKDEFIKLLNPSDVINPQLKNVFCRLFSLKSIIRYPIFNKAIQLLKNKFKDINPPIESFDASATLNFCTLVSYGDGYTIPVMIPARPRIGITWSANFSETYAGEVFSNKGFYAKGSQSGSTIGFTGGGGTFAFPGFKFYVFVGYTWHVKVSADHIDFYPPNQPPVISDENPINGAIDVPITLSELSFRIGDPEGEKMDYTVTTNPDIGTGSGTGKVNGVYTIPVSGLEYDKMYTWTVELTEGNFIVDKEFIFFTPIKPPFDPFDEGWKYRKKITIDHNMVDGDLVDFPVLISVIDSDIKNKAQIDGDDILFMDDIGIASKLFHEIEKYDSSNGDLVVWVRIPSLSSIMDTDFYVYYGNSDCSNQQYPSRVWNSNYQGIWHLHETPKELVEDSTLNNNDGVSYGDMNQYDLVDGKIGKCIDFDGDDDYISIQDSTSLKPEEVTLITWFKPLEQNSSNGFFLSKNCHDFYNNADGHTFGFHWLGNNDTLRGGIEQNLGSPSQWAKIGYYPISKNNWYYLVLSFNESSDTGIFYVNGNEIARKSMLHSSALWYNQPWDFLMGASRVNEGSSHTINRWFKCQLDEVRVINYPLETYWISTEYNNQNNPSNFYSIGPEET